MHARGSFPGSFPHPISVAQCPLCHASATPLETNVVEEGKEKNLLHIRCKSCENALLAVVFLRPDGIVSVGVPTDCTSEDASRFHEANPVQSDDVLSVYTQLADTKGFFKALQK